MIDQLISAVAEHTATTEDGEHLVVLSYYPDLIHSDGRVVSVQQASGYLHLGDWTPVVSTCGTADCCRLEHLEEQANQLVAAHAISLADLYRAGRKRGLLTAHTAGYGG